jgi:serine/threonine-protein kinase
MNMSVSVPGYRVLEAVGSGAAGSVYMAQDSAGQTVAMKLVSADGPGGQKAVDELKREFKILGRLDHPGIPRAHRLQRTDAGACLIMDYCFGKSLRKLLRQDPGRVSFMLPELLERSADILQHMHDHGVVHRDFKPENLVIRSDGAVFLVDMALAWRPRLLGGKPALAGTPAYMAPELLAGRPPSAASDAYSYAATAYELLAGRPPFEGHSRDETLRAVRRGGAPRPSRRNRTLTAELDRLILKGLSMDPGERPANLVVYGRQLASAIRTAGIGRAPR